MRSPHSVIKSTRTGHHDGQADPNWLSEIEIKKTKAG